MNKKEALIIVDAISGLGILAVSLLSFSKKQRDSIAFDRDEGQCKAPFDHQCNAEAGLEVHHVLPQRYGGAVGIEEEYLDVPENAVSVCTNAHDDIHPDRVKAKREYFSKKEKGEDSYEEMFEERRRKIERREIYWNDEHDRQLRAVAIRQTQNAQKRGWSFPEKKKRKGRDASLEEELQYIPEMS